MGNFPPNQPAKKVVANFSHKSILDLRAPHRLQLLHLSPKQKRIIPLILLGDIMAF